MKGLFTRIVAACLLYPACSASAQTAPDYQFNSYSLVSGTALTKGAVYKFTNVKSGVDARLTINDITGGISVTDIDGSGGFSKALQPVISAPSKKNGYIEFKLEFLVAGTNTLSIQDIVPVTPIDVDGQTYSGLPVYEYDEIEMPNGYTYFQYAGSELTMTMSSGWAKGKNNTAVDYPGIDTVQKTVMFTTVNANISSFYFRVGADNQSNSSVSRLRSLYFQKFTYPYSVVLPNRTLISFSGAEKNHGVEISGKLSASHTYTNLVIERGKTSSSFEPVVNIDISQSASAEFPFTWFDSHPDDKVNFYRVRLVNTNHNIYELSNVLMIRMNSAPSGGIRLVNTLIRKSDPSVSLQSSEEKPVSIRLVDMSGRTLYQAARKLYAGMNVVDLSGLDKSAAGYFVLVMNDGEEQYNRKVIIQ